MSLKFSPVDVFEARHNAPGADAQAAMLRTIGVDSLEQLINETVPPAIRLKKPLNLPAALSERAFLAKFKQIASQNQVFKSYIGLGYHDTTLPPVIQRNILENPGWYTAYTPYQAEIAQGRLDALINYQTMVAALTGLPLANSSLLDEATAAAEAMAMCRAIVEGKRNTFLVSENCHPQTIAVVQTRARSMGINCVVVN